MNKYSLIQTISISKKFGRDVIFSDFSASIDSNKIYTFIGPSGSGKTTTMKILNGFIPSSSGTVELSSKSITSTNSFVEIPFFDELNMRENLILSECDMNNPIFSNLNLTILFDKNPDQLSSGEINRFLVARALAAGSDIKYLDEPTSHLDSINAKKILDEIIKCSKRSTVVISMHNLEQAKSFSDVVYIMKDNQWVVAYNSNKADKDSSVVQKNDKSETHKDILKKYVKSRRKLFLKSTVIFNTYISIFVCFSFSILTQYLLNQSALADTFQLLACKWLIYILAFLFVVNLIFHIKKDYSFKKKDAQIFNSINLDRQSYNYINRLYSSLTTSILFICFFIISLLIPLLTCLLLFGKTTLALLTPFYSWDYFTYIICTGLIFSACVIFYNYVVFKKVRY